MKDFFIQAMRDHTIQDIVQNENDMIFSNTDALYLDCGYGAFVGSEGNNWCSPYKGQAYFDLNETYNRFQIDDLSKNHAFLGWQMQYNNDPYEILARRGIDVTEEIKQRIRGSEAAMWSEQV